MKVLLILFCCILNESVYCRNEGTGGFETCGNFEQCESRHIFNNRNKRETKLCMNDACYHLVKNSLSKYKKAFKITKKNITALAAGANDVEFRKALEVQLKKINDLLHFAENAETRDALKRFGALPGSVLKMESKLKGYWNVIGQSDLKAGVDSMEDKLTKLEELDALRLYMFQKLVDINDTPKNIISKIAVAEASLSSYSGDTKQLISEIKRLNQTGICDEIASNYANVSSKDLIFSIYAQKNRLNLTILEESGSNKIVAKSVKEKAIALKVPELIPHTNEDDKLKEIKLQLKKYTRGIKELSKINSSNYNTKLETIDTYLKNLTDITNLRKHILSTINEFDTFYNSTEENGNVSSLKMTELEYVIDKMNDLMDMYLNLLEAQENFVKLFETYADSKQTLYEDLLSAVKMQEDEISMLLEILQKLNLDLHVTKGNQKAYQKCIEKIEKSILKAEAFDGELIAIEFKIKAMEDELELLEKEKMELFEMKQREKDLEDEIRYLEEEVERLKIIGEHLGDINITCIPKISLN